MTIMPSPEESVSLFRTSWSLYDAVVEGNCMFHAEFTSLLGSRITALTERGTYRLLDLGCGNARCLAPVLSGHPPASYHGIDLSESALAEAKEYLRDVSGVRLELGDLLTVTEALVPSSVGIVFSGFAIHHLDTASKERLFRAVGRVLQPGGRFLLVDIARREGEGRAEYLERYLGFMRSWSALDEGQLAEACHHVASYDFPEPLPDLLAMGERVGLACPVSQVSFGDHHLLEFAKGSSSTPDSGKMTLRP